MGPCLPFFENWDLSMLKVLQRFLRGPVLWLAYTPTPQVAWLNDLGGGPKAKFCPMLPEGGVKSLDSITGFFEVTRFFLWYQDFSKEGRPL